MASGAPDLPATVGGPAASDGRIEPKDGFTLAMLGLWIVRFANLIERNVEPLTEMDAAIGDADHGVNMNRGMAVVRASLGDLAGPDTNLESACRAIGRTIASEVGGAAGLLYSTFLLGLGAGAGRASYLPPVRFSEALRVGVDRVVAKGHAQLGDKTMVDAMAPAIDAFESAVGLGAWNLAPAAAVRAASEGCERVIPLVARKGRASYLGPRSAGHADPGAASTLLLYEALRDAIATETRSQPDPPVAQGRAS
jgi:phosphoenolpyruvate---glycerone phosphotransferase subunit DhaL